MKRSSFKYFTIFAIMGLPHAVGCGGSTDTHPFGSGGAGTGTASTASTSSDATSATGAGGASGTSSGSAGGAGTASTSGSGSASTSGSGSASTSGSGSASTSGSGSASTSGSGSASTSASSSTGGPTALAPGDLVFTELMNNPAVVSDDAGEWMEIHNASGQLVDLGGLILTDGTNNHTIAASVKIAPGGYAVLGVNANTATNGNVPIDYQYSLIKMFNTKGTLTLRTAAMLVIDTTSYDAASGLNPNGQSRTLDPNFLTAALNDTDVHWCPGTTYISGNTGDRGTPGKPNDACP